MIDNLFSSDVTDKELIDYAIRKGYDKKPIVKFYIMTVSPSDNDIIEIDWSDRKNKKVTRSCSMKIYP